MRPCLDMSAPSGGSQRHSGAAFGAVAQEACALCPEVNGCGVGRLSFCCPGLAPLAGFAHAQWWLTEALGALCQGGAHALRGGLVLKLHDQGVYGQAAGKREFRISSAWQCALVWIRARPAAGAHSGTQE